MANGPCCLKDPIYSLSGVQGYHARDPQLSCVVSCAGLEALDVTHNHLMDDHVMEGIARLTNLTALYMDRLDNGGWHGLPWESR